MASKYYRNTSPSGSLEMSQKIPRIDLNLWDHKKALFIPAFAIIMTSGVLPLAGYIILHYATNIKTAIIVTILVAIFGVSSLSALIMRTWSLSRRSSTCRPLGSTSRWTLDYFGWNFLGGFIALSIVIAIGLVLSPTNLRILSMPLSLLLVQVCLQLVVFVPLRIMRVRAPFRFSSLEKGEPMRPACYTIAEDIVAVDGKQGDVFRAVWNARYEASPPFRHLLAQMDILWGCSGLVVAVICLVTIWAVNSTTVGWAVGRSLMASSACFEVC